MAGCTKQEKRESFSGLTELALVHLGGRLDRDALCVFTNRTRTRIKLLYFDGTGLWVATKRMEAGAFSWPAAGGAGQKKLKLAPEALAAMREELARKDQIIAWLQKTIFGRSSERLDPNQLDLGFDEATLG